MNVPQQVQFENIPEGKPKQSQIYRWILAFLKPYKATVGLLILSGLFVSSSEILIPKMIQYFIDVIYPAKDYRSFTYLLLMIAGLC